MQQQQQKESRHSSYTFTNINPKLITDININFQKNIISRYNKGKKSVTLKWQRFFFSYSIKNMIY